MPFTLAHPDIQTALADLRRIILPHAADVESVELFGSTLTVAVEEARDIDFFVAYRGKAFEVMRAALMSSGVARHVVVESLEAEYSNCPSWDLRSPLTIHIVLYRKGVSRFSDKLARTRAAALDVTRTVLSNPAERPRDQSPAA